MSETKEGTQTTQFNNTNLFHCESDIVISEEPNRKDEVHFSDLLKYKLLSFNFKYENNNGSKSHKSYTNCFKWDINALEQIPLGDEIDRERLIMYLNPQKGITYSQAKELLSNNPNTLVTAMTLLTNNYQMGVEEVKDKIRIKQQKERVSSDTSPHFLFTEEENIIFVTGIKMLTELDGTYNSEYIKELIKQTKNLLCIFNEGLVLKVVNKYKEREKFEDLAQEGYVGLLRALETFDISNGSKFSTYAYWWIRQKIARYVSNKAQIIREPVHFSDGIKRFTYAKKVLEAEEEREVTIDEAINYCDMKNIKIPLNRDLLKRSIKQRAVISLDKSYGEDEDTSLMDVIPKKEESVEDTVSAQMFDGLFNFAGLNPREQMILRMRWGLIPGNQANRVEHSLDEIGEKMGLTRERVRQLEEKATKKLECLKMIYNG